MKSDASTLHKPLAGLAFHYDSFISDERGTAYEAAYISSNPKIKVRVLCSLTNLQTVKVGVNLSDSLNLYQHLRESVPTRD